MGYVVALLWFCAVTGAAGILLLVHELTTPTNTADEIDGNDYHRMSEALDERRRRHSPGTVQ